MCTIVIFLFCNLYICFIYSLHVIEYARVCWCAIKKLRDRSVILLTHKWVEETDIQITK